MPLNRQRLDEIVRFFGPAKSAAMIAKVPATLDEHVSALTAPQAAPDLRQRAHRLKGLAAMYGLDDLAAVALRIETEVLDPYRLLGALAELSFVVADGKAHLRAFIAELERAAETGCAA